MKKTLLVLSIAILLIANLSAQSITVTSLDTNPAEVNSDFTVNIEYTTANANDIIYIGLELKNSDGSWAATIAEAFINPVGASGTDVSTSAVVTVPSGVTPSASLTGGQYYELKVELNAEAWAGWLAGDYPGMTLVAEGTLSLEDNQINQLRVFPNPVSDKIQLGGVSNNISHIKITDLFGKVVYSDKAFKREYINISNLTAGIYILSVSNDNKVSNVKFVKR